MIHAVQAGRRSEHSVDVRRRERRDDGLERRAPLVLVAQPLDDLPQRGAWRGRGAGDLAQRLDAVVCVEPDSALGQLG